MNDRVARVVLLGAFGFCGWAFSNEGSASGRCREGKAPDRETPPAPRDSNPSPLYPEEARRKGWEGTVWLRIEVRADGTVGRISRLRSSGYAPLDRAAIDALRRWRFEPAHCGNDPVPCRVDLPVLFMVKSGPNPRKPKRNGNPSPAS